MGDETYDDYHCAECMDKSTVFRTESPSGNTYWVCNLCVEAVENGTAIVVKHE